MTTKHTPGPWIASRGQHSPKSKDRSCFWVVNQADDGREDLMPRICDAIAPEGFDGFQQGEANARLIAAAPELLEACQAAFAELANDPTWHVSFLRLDVLRAAIAKAAGNPA